MAVINPPNTPLIDGGGRITPEWYRFLVAIQKNLGELVVADEESLILSGGSSAGANGDTQSAAVAEARIAAMPCQCVASDTGLPAPPHHEIWPDILVPPTPELDPPDGSSHANIRTITFANTPYSPSYFDSMILVDATGGPVTVLLPPASISRSRLINIKKIDASVNAVTIDGNGGELIDGQPTQVITAQYMDLTCHCDGIGWWIA